MKVKLSIVAMLLIILGFGVIHGKSQTRELAGNICIGIGSLYFLYLLIMSNRKQIKKDKANEMSTGK